MTGKTTATSYFRLQLIVFALVSASFTNIYITQPVLPVLQQEFGADMVRVSFTVSAVIFGIALANLPFGSLADKVRIQPIVLTGGLCVALAGFVCSLTHNLYVLIAARFLQGIFIPALTTCLAAYLAKTLPIERLNVVMGSYVSATVLGGLGGRMLGGFIHPPLHWRYAFVTASILILSASLAALIGLPKARVQPGAPKPGSVGFLQLLKRGELLPLFFCATGSFAIFSSIFNYLPYRLTSPPFNYSTETTTLVYLVYIVGIFIGPLAGRVSNRFGGGVTLLSGSAVLLLSMAILLIPNPVGVVAGLLVLCAGFFTIHSAAVGALNRKLSSGQGKANALYVLFYYSGGWLGITCSGLAYQHGGWSTVVFLTMAYLAIPVCAGLVERKHGH